MPAASRLVTREMIPLTSIASPNLTTLKPPESRPRLTPRTENRPSESFRATYHGRLGQKALPLGRWTFKVALSMGVGDPWGGVFLPPPLPCTPPTPPPPPSPTPVLIPSWLPWKRKKENDGRSRLSRRRGNEHVNYALSRKTSARAAPTNMEACRED